ncbi:phosphoribosyl-ATP diphosphatase [Nitrospirillum pindoramense]|uniref:phosphoribosyl-ATP diphosphatase n=1 Tax=Nitrospirillum amazonense TaxID=28077 RepID=A0A560HFW3_9PROT|nr:phosphoribosyl-ATP diphosphatase [Nitrospirillum amazonense]TWB44230.1 phosphoribosyl-ATP pyrophosphatase [Nitrospirillum amazonense]
MNSSVVLLSVRAESVALPCSAPAVADEVARLYGALDHVSPAKNPRTAQLLRAGLRKISQKVVEETAEVALEGVRKRPDAAVRESADLLYNLVVLWHALDIRPDDVWAEMRRRADAFGLAEKLPKQPCVVGEV